MTLDGVLLWSTSQDSFVHTLDIDTVSNMLYYFESPYMKRIPLDQLDDTPGNIFTDWGLIADSIAVDWIGRYYVFFSLTTIDSSLQLYTIAAYVSLLVIVVTFNAI